MDRKSRFFLITELNACNCRWMDVVWKWKTKTNPLLVGVLAKTPHFIIKDPISHLVEKLTFKTLKYLNVKSYLLEKQWRKLNFQFT